jgi:hypothetical protein
VKEGTIGKDLYKDRCDPDLKDLIEEPQDLDFEQPELRDFRRAGSEVHVTYLGGDTDSNNALGVYTFDRKTGLIDDVQILFPEAGEVALGDAFKFELDINEDVYAMAAVQHWCRHNGSKRMAIWILGGGVPKNYTLQGEPLLDQILVGAYPTDKLAVRWALRRRVPANDDQSAIKGISMLMPIHADTRGCLNGRRPGPSLVVGGHQPRVERSVVFPNHHQQLLAIGRTNELGLTRIEWLAEIEGNFPRAPGEPTVCRSRLG